MADFEVSLKEGIRNSHIFIRWEVLLQYKQNNQLQIQLLRKLRGNCGL